MKREETKKGEHWEDTPWVVQNPLWPSGSEPYLALCKGCAKCDPESHEWVAFSNHLYRPVSTRQDKRK